MRASRSSRLTPRFSVTCVKRPRAIRAHKGCFTGFRPTNRLSPPPISHIHIDSNSRSLSIQVFHSFPEERAIVRTQSRYEIRK